MSLPALRLLHLRSLVLRRPAHPRRHHRLKNHPQSAVSLLEIRTQPPRPVPRIVAVCGVCAYRPYVIPQRPPPAPARRAGPEVLRPFLLPLLLPPWRRRPALAAAARRRRRRRGLPPPPPPPPPAALPRSPPVDLRRALAERLGVYPAELSQLATAPRRAYESARKRGDGRRIAGLVADRGSRLKRRHVRRVDRVDRLFSAATRTKFRADHRGAFSPASCRAAAARRRRAPPSPMPRGARGCHQNTQPEVIGAILLEGSRYLRHGRPCGR